MNPMQSTMSPQTPVYIHCTLLTYALEQLCLTHCICMSHCTTTIAYMQDSTLLYTQAKQLDQ